MGHNPLDEALAAYSQAEPPVGIEQRILGRVASERAKRRWIISGASLSATAAICAVFVLFEPGPGITITPLPIRVETAVAQPMPHAPRQAPAPPPLTREERAWMTLGESGVLAGVKSGDIEPLQIEELTIPPLESDGGE